MDIWVFTNINNTNTIWVYTYISDMSEYPFGFWFGTGLVPDIWV